MKMLLQGCLEGIDIDVVEMTYAELSTEGNRCDVFRKYDIQFIITTSKLMIQGVTTLMLNELIDERGEKVIYSTVGRYCDKDKTQRFIENIVRSFTIKNLIGQLTILNPDKIMGDVEETVSDEDVKEGINRPRRCLRVDGHELEPEARRCSGGMNDSNVADPASPASGRLGDFEVKEHVEK